MGKEPVEAGNPIKNENLKADEALNSKFGPGSEDSLQQLPEDMLLDQILEQGKKSENQTLLDEIDYRSQDGTDQKKINQQNAQPQNAQPQDAKQAAQPQMTQQMAGQDVEQDHFNDAQVNDAQASAQLSPAPSMMGEAPSLDAQNDGPLATEGGSSKAVPMPVFADTKTTNSNLSAQNSLQNPSLNQSEMANNQLERQQKNNQKATNHPAQQDQKVNRKVSRFSFNKISQTISRTIDRIAQLYYICCSVPLSIFLLLILVTTVIGLNIYLLTSFEERS
ncbi:MAG: hypothetical protein AAF403_04560, partial [Pseudomonadota bacterium]